MKNNARQFLPNIKRGLQTFNVYRLKTQAAIPGPQALDEISPLIYEPLHIRKLRGSRQTAVLKGSA